MTVDTLEMHSDVLEEWHQWQTKNAVSVGTDQEARMVHQTQMVSGQHSSCLAVDSSDGSLWIGSREQTAGTGKR